MTSNHIQALIDVLDTLIGNIELRASVAQLIRNAAKRGYRQGYEQGAADSAAHRAKE